MVREGDHVFSFDSNGGVRIWHAINFQYFRSFETGIKHSKPSILHGKIYSVEQQTQQLKVWALTDVLDPNNEKPQPQIIKLESNCSSFCVAIRNELWIGGDGILVLSEDGNFTSLGEKNLRTLYCSFTEVDNTVWALQGKKILIWDIASKELKHELADKFPKGNPQDILTLGNDLWISGRIAAKGAIWIMNASTFEVEAELTKHNSEVYMCQAIGDLVWSVSWDKMIYTWRPEDHLFVAQIKNFHTDAIQAIFSVPRKEGDGWIVWTASSDSTINVLFVPNNYSEALISQAKLTSLPQKSNSRPLLSPVLIQEAHPTKLTVDAKSILRKSSPREDGTGGGAGGASSEDKSQETSPVPQKLTTSNDLEDESSSPKGGTASSLKFGDLRTSGRKEIENPKRKQKKDLRAQPPRKSLERSDPVGIDSERPLICTPERSIDSSEAESSDYLAKVSADLLLQLPPDDDPLPSPETQSISQEPEPTENLVKAPLSLRSLFDHQPETQIPTTDTEDHPLGNNEKDLSITERKEESDPGYPTCINED